ncbi:MAG: GNAT family N-acetyltransferase [Oscillospiraceae bacterium]|jgi:predicted acetyltransferase|nr:GNAT family N-acetyltransferase [Oscillospiraceae bacterium]
MHVRELTPEDLDAHCRVSAMAFHWSYKPGEETFPEHERLLGCFDDGGTLLADLEFAVRQAVVGATTLPLVCIGGVAALPFARRQGAVRQLFLALECLAQQEGWALGALYPFSTAYYRKFGYENTLCSLRVTVAMRHLDALAATIPAERQGSVELVEGERGLAELLEVYNTAARRHQMMLLRHDARQFHTKPLEEKKYSCLWRSTQGEAQGYVSYQLNTGTHTLEVEEIVFHTPEALYGLLCYLRVYNKADAVCFEQVPPGSPLLLALREYNDGGLNAIYRFLASFRLYDPEALLRSHRYPQQPGAFTLAVAGDTLECCNGVYAVQYTNGAATLERRPADAPAALTLTREAAARLLLSGQTTDSFALRFLPGVTLAESETAQAEQADFLRAFAATSTALWDGF